MKQFPESWCSRYDRAVVIGGKYRQNQRLVGEEGREGFILVEVGVLMATQGSVPHYVKDVDDTLKGRITTNLGDMERYLRESALVLWGLCQNVASGVVEKGKTSMVVVE